MPSEQASVHRYLDLATWPRREAFDYFRSFDKPYFNVCVRVDAAPLKAAVKARGVGSFALAYHFIALRLADEIEAFRYRLHDGRVRILDEIAGGATVLRDDDSFGFAYLPHTTDWAQFAAAGSAAIAAAQQRQAGFEPRVGFDELVHFTTLPWLHFSSFSHARNWGREDSIPKISFGRADASGASFRDADLEGAFLTAGVFARASFRSADMTGASLANARFDGADFRDADLSRAALAGTDLSNALGLTQNQIDDACSGPGTRLPRGLVPRTCRGNQHGSRQEFRAPPIPPLPPIPSSIRR